MLLKTGGVDAVALGAPLLTYRLAKGTSASNLGNENALLDGEHQPNDTPCGKSDIFMSVIHPG